MNVKPAPETELLPCGFDTGDSALLPTGRRTLNTEESVVPYGLDSLGCIADLLRVITSSG